MTYEEFKRRHPDKTAEKPKGNRHEEDDIQIQCVGWFREHYPDLSLLLFHPNNEAYFGGFSLSKEQRYIKGKRAKDKGVTPGVADLILLYPSAPHHGLCIEMKTSKGIQEPPQKIWQAAVERRYYRYEIVRSLDEFQRLIASYTGRQPLDHEQAALEKIFGKPINIHKHKTSEQ